MASFTIETKGARSKSFLGDNRLLLHYPIFYLHKLYLY